MTYLRFTQPICSQVKLPCWRCGLRITRGKLSERHTGCACYFEQVGEVDDLGQEMAAQVSEGDGGIW